MRQRIKTSAKIIRPVIPRVYLRKRLFKLLNDGLKYKSVWINGPPGSGKTTLVSSYLEKKKIPSIWYQVDAGDNDAATFFHYLSLAVKLQQKSGKLKDLPHFTSEYQGGLSTFTRNFFHELFKQIPPHSVIVFDNFQEAAAYSGVPPGVLDSQREIKIPPFVQGGAGGVLSANPKFMEIIHTAIQEIPTDCSIIFISRTPPPSLFARHRANRDMTVIDSDELLLSDEDVSGIAKVLGCPLSGSDAVSRIQDMINGWTAGLVLMTRHINEGDIKKDKAFVSGGTGRKVIFDYFMSEVFEKMDEGAQDFLVKTALFNEMTVDMARKLTLNPDSGEILHQLERSRFFTNTRNHEEAIYQYHPLFRGFLQFHADRRFKRQEWRDITAMAANVLKGAGFSEDAARLFITAEEWEGLEEVISDQAELLLSQGRYQVLESWIMAIPAEVMNQSPWLLYYLGQCCIPQNPALARKSLEAAYRLFKAEKNIIPPPSTGGGEGEGDPTGLFLSWSSIVETFLYEWKDFKPFDHYLQEIEGIRGDYPDFPTTEIEERTVSAVFSAMMFRQPQNPALPHWEGRALNVIHSSKDAVRRLTVGHTVILYYLWTGHIAKAKIVLDTLSQVYKTSVNYSLPHLMWLRTAALYYIYTSQPQISREMTEEGLGIIEKTGMQLLNVIFLGQGIYDSIFLGDKDSAYRYFNRLTTEREKIRCYARVSYHHQASNIAMHFGNATSDITHALEQAVQYLRHCEELGSPFIMNLSRSGLAFYKLEAGKPESIKGDIAEIRRIGRAVKSNFHEYLCLLLESLSAMKGGSRNIFADRFSAAMSLSKETGLSTFVFTTLPTAARLCAMGIEAGIDVPYVRELIRRLNLTAYYTPEPDVPDWPWGVKIYTLGRFEIWIDDKKIEFSGKVQKKPLSLLKMLIAANGKEVTEEDVIDALWPDSDGDQASQAFSMALCRLRRLIGSDKAIIYSNGKLNIDRQYCWSDIRSFNHLLRQSEEVDAGGRIRFIQKAIGVYEGHFLPGDIKEPWTLSQRERLRNRFIMAINRLGQYHEERGEIDNAIACYNKGIETDELAERLYQRLMLCHQHTGNRTEAVRIYKRLKTLLSIHLSIEPSRETETIYKAILAG